jgi:hypothetical protein
MMTMTTAFAALAACVIAASPAMPHEKGVLKPATRTLMPGDSLAIGGEKFTKKDEVILVLLGVNGRVELGTVPTDSVGKFRRSFLVPATLKSGAYRLIAEAIDGDEVATIDVVVQAMHAMASAGAMPGMTHDMSQMALQPTGERLPLVPARPPAVLISLAILIVACAAGGTLLLRQPHVQTPEK